MKEFLVLAGPSGGGKTTVATKLIEMFPGFELVRSVTSRPPRGDKFDAEYIYLTDSDFDNLIKNDGVLEYTEYAGYKYGTPRAEIDRIIGEGKTPLLILDLDGVKSVTAAFKNACAVYIYDDIRVVDQRLYERYLGANPSSEGLIRYVKRKEQNNQDYLSVFDFAGYFYAFVSNSGTREESAAALYESFKAFVEHRERNENAISLACDFIKGSLRAAYM